MKTLGAKLKNKKGFTLMEMLIVVAIMVILVAVSIPVFTSQVNKAKEAADDANMRAAKSTMLTAYMMGELSPAAASDTTIVRYYDADNGKLTANGTTKPANATYGQGSTYNGEDTKGKCIKLTLTIASGEIAIDWD